MRKQVLPGSWPGWGSVMRRNRLVLIKVPLLMLKEFYGAPEADNISFVLHLHKKPVFRFSQMHIYSYKFVSYT